MKALSLRQPWLYAIMKLGKRVENRDWRGCSYRGPVLLHASSRVVLTPTKRDPESFGDAVDRILEIVRPAPGAERLRLLRPMAVMRVKLRGAHHGEGVWHPAPTLQLGGILGRARIVGEVKSERDLAEHGAAWWGGGFGLLLAEVEPLPFMPWKGSLGLFEVPDDVVNEAIRQRPIKASLERMP